LAGDKVLLAEIRPFDLALITQSMSLRERHEKTLLPQGRHVAIRGTGYVHDKPDIKLPSPNECDLLSRGPLINLNDYIRMPGGIRLDQLAKKSGRHRGQDADIQATDATAPGRASGFNRAFEQSKSVARLLKEGGAGVCDPHAAGMSYG
jgi:hypothetical protein